ncbi:uncharacterized protein LOC131605968 [Vicia villosa]|uniref:uncharacterized protein LOC131605968 n=1 Tax=Vicia villosa TaxID=3911 RepID=UPI00273AA955|nr:uncharacterized protein LOC131605968 [Vicia villosa]
MEKMKILHYTQQGPWCAVGDFNNVITVQDKIWSKLVTENEYRDIQSMMQNVGLHDMDSNGDTYTWFNQQMMNLIYSHIDRVLANVDWLQANNDLTINIMPPNVSDHAMLYLAGPGLNRNKSHHFKFNNNWVDVKGYNEVVERSWKQPLRGKPMAQNELMSNRMNEESIKKVKS